MKIKVPYCPDYPEAIAVTIGEKQIAFVSLVQDECGVNPCIDWDGFGTFHSLGRRHHNHNEQCLEILKKDKDAVALSYFEHGNSLWMVAELPSPAGVEFQWDGTRMAGVWEPDNVIKKTADDEGLKPGTPERRAWMVKQAEDACVIYTYWCNGQIFGYQIEIFDKRESDGEVYDDLRDYRYDTAEYEDSCYGFYGSDDVVCGANEALAGRELV